MIWQDSNPYPQLEELTKTPEYVFVRELPGVLKDDQSLAYDSPITSDLEEVLFPHPGAIVHCERPTWFQTVGAYGQRWSHSL